MRFPPVVWDDLARSLLELVQGGKVGHRPTRLPVRNTKVTCGTTVHAGTVVCTQVSWLVSWPTTLRWTVTALTIIIHAAAVHTNSY